MTAPRTPVTADRTLVALVDTIDSDSEPHQQGTALILTLGGQVVSGFLIPSWQWFEEVTEISARALAENGGDAGAESIEGTLARLASVARIKDRDEMLASRDALEALPIDVRKTVYEASTPDYIHLRGARVFSPGAGMLPTNRPLHWRGRLSEVAGWSFGVLEQAS